MSANNLDFFGVDSEGAYRHEDLPALRTSAVDRAREDWKRADAVARRHPNLEQLRRQAAQAEAAYLSLRDFEEQMSLREVSARAVATSEEPERCEHTTNMDL